MKTQIIKLFYNDLLSQFTIHELAKKIDTSYSYVHRQISLLEKEGLLTINRQSNRRYCRPNYGHPEIKTLFVQVSNQITEDFLRKGQKNSLIIEHLLSVLPKKTDYNLLSIVLFGSLAKRTGSKKSDMDLFVLVPSKKKYDESIEMECVALSRSFGVDINPIVCEPNNLLTMLRERDINVGKELLKNKIILFGAEKFWELVFEVIK